MYSAKGSLQMKVSMAFPIRQGTLKRIVLLAILFCNLGSAGSAETKPQAYRKTLNQPADFRPCTLRLPLARPGSVARNEACRRA